AVVHWPILLSCLRCCSRISAWSISSPLSGGCLSEQRQYRKTCHDDGRSNSHANLLMGKSHRYYQRIRGYRNCEILNSNFPCYFSISQVDLVFGDHADPLIGSKILSASVAGLLAVEF